MNNRLNYKFITIIGDKDVGLYGLSCDLYRSQMWSICKCRKIHVCQITDEAIQNGDECFRPITNGYNRMERISAKGMKLLKIMTESEAENG